MHVHDVCQTHTLACNVITYKCNNRMYNIVGIPARLDLKYTFPRVHSLAEPGKMPSCITEILRQTQFAIKQGFGRLRNIALD